MFLYETWTQSKSDINIDGYRCVHFYRKFQNRRANRCSVGIAVYVKDCILDGIKIVRNHYDSVIWLKMERHFFKLILMLYCWCLCLG